jgi:signal transduction histidine kinase
MATAESTSNRMKEQVERIGQYGAAMQSAIGSRLRDRWQDRRPVHPTTTVSDVAFSILVGAGCILLPLIVLGPLSSHIQAAVAIAMFVVAIGVATHLGEWPGALTAITFGLLAIDVFWIGEPSSAGIPRGGQEVLTLGTFAIAGLVLAWLIQEVKEQSLSARRDAQAARSATYALNSIEADAAAYASEGSGERSAIYNSLLRAMVASNRTAFGALLLVNERGELEPVAGYGMNPESIDDVAPQFIEEIVETRHIRSVSDTHRDPRFAGSPIRASGVRSLMGGPIFGSGDRIVGIVLTGLHAPHHYSAAEEYRLSALTDKASSILVALTAVEEREVALQTAERRQGWLERVISAMPEAVIVIDQPSGYVIAQNNTTNRLLGDLTGRSLADLNERLRDGDGRAMALAESPLAQALANLEPIAGVELVALEPDGTEVPVLVSAASVVDENDPSPAVVIVFREISALKEASRLKDEFVSIVSHELRSPLTPILGFVQLVARDLRRKGGHEDNLKRLDSAAAHVDRMTRLVEDLLDVSRLKAGLLDLRRTEVNLGDICQEVVNDRIAGGTKHTLAIEQLPFDVIGNWDSDRLYQVIDNLVGNAIKYTPEDGQILIRMDEDPLQGTATVSVEDEGPGIPPEERDQLFSAFFRTKSAASSQVAGLGLGLYICQELVTAHGGTISVDESPSGGAAFRVQLPLSVEAPSSKPAALA